MPRYEGTFRCPICGILNSDVLNSQYDNHICQRCDESGVIKQLDNIFRWFVQNRKPKFLERWKFNILETLAYNAYRYKVEFRARNIKKVRQRQINIRIDSKYTEEERVLGRSW